MSSRQFLKSSAIKHQIYLQRYAGSINKQLISFIKNLKNKVVKTLESSGELTNFSKKRLKLLESNLRDITKALTKDINGKLKNSMFYLAKYEADFTQRLLVSATSLKQNVLVAPFESVAPTVKQLQSAAFTDIVNKTIPTVGGYDVKGVTVAELLDNFSSKSISKGINIIRQGYAGGITTDVISKGLRETFEGLTRKASKTIARTVTNHTAAQARHAVYKANDDIITKYEVVATLDTLTTLTCSNLDGVQFDIDDFVPPPYHYNCRSTFIGIVDKKYNIGLADPGRPTKDEEGSAGELVDSNTKFNLFLKDESNNFKKDFLGETRFKLYEAGMPLGDFVDHNYSPINLDELRNKDNEFIFKKAGL